MIGIALQLELRTLLRSPARLFIVAFVLAAGGLVIAQGKTEVAQWNEAIAAGQAEQDEMFAEARGYFENGEHGPADRNWIDLRQPRWQDMYAATRLARLPAPLAGIAFAAAESGAVTIQLSRYADPLLSDGNRIENPALAVTGGLDLATVLAMLLPLLILALGVEIGGFERSAGVLPLVRVQSGRGRNWIWARCLAVGLITALVALALVIAAAWAYGAGLNEAAPLAFLVLAYVAVWTALLGAVAIVSRTPSQGAIGLGAAWVLFCVLIPAVGAERSAALAADDFALDLTVDAREHSSEVRAMAEPELYDAILARFPELAESVPESRRAGVRAATDGMHIVGLEERMEQRNQSAAAHRQLVGTMTLASPVLAFTRALEEIAGRGPEAAQRFREAAVDAIGARIGNYIATSWSGTELGADDFEALVASTPTRIEAPRASWWMPLAILLGWTLALALFAMRLGRRRVN